MKTREIVQEYEKIRDKMVSATDAADVACAILVLAGTMNEVAKSIQNLGVADAATPMGAIEMLAMEVKNGLDGLNVSIQNISEAIDFNAK